MPMRLRGGSGGSVALHHKTRLGDRALSKKVAQRRNSTISILLHHTSKIPGCIGPAR
jgi:hypothetical protein